MIDGDGDEVVHAEDAVEGEFFSGGIFEGDVGDEDGGVGVGDGNAFVGGEGEFIEEEAGRFLVPPMPPTERVNCLSLGMPRRRGLEPVSGA